MVLCPTFGHDRNCPAGPFRHIKVIDALLIRQGQKSPSCRLGVLGAQIILAPGCSSLIKTVQLQTFLSFRSLERTLFSWLHCLFSFSHSDPPHSSSLSGLCNIYIYIYQVFGSVWLFADSLLPTSGGLVLKPTSFFAMSPGDVHKRT